MNCRPKQQLSDDEDDFVWLSDDELGEALVNPGTWERYAMTRPGNPGATLILRDVSRRIYNYPDSDEKAE